MACSMQGLGEGAVVRNVIKALTPQLLKGRGPNHLPGTADSIHYANPPFS